ncbi:MAG: hypothetical protein AAF206_15700 [Bacteroidota bacterium]
MSQRFRIAPHNKLQSGLFHTLKRLFQFGMAGALLLSVVVLHPLGKGRNSARGTIEAKQKILPGQTVKLNAIFTRPVDGQMLRWKIPGSSNIHFASIEAAAGESWELMHPNELVVHPQSWDDIQLKVHIRVPLNLALSLHEFPMEITWETAEGSLAVNLAESMQHLAVDAPPLEVVSQYLYQDPQQKRYHHFSLLIHNPADGVDYQAGQGLLGVFQQTNLKEARVIDVRMENRRPSHSFVNGNAFTIDDMPLRKGETRSIHFVVEVLPRFAEKLISTAIAFVPHTSIRAQSKSSPRPQNLPLASWEARNDSGTALLAWQTNSEHNNQGFAIEMRVNDSPFRELDTVMGMGSTDEPQQYRFEGPELFSGIYQFRLRQLSADGVPRFSEIRELRIPTQK